MKWVFTLSFLIMLIMTGVMYLSEPDVRSDVPLIYWVTDPNPARQKQIAAFHEWLVEQGLVTADGGPRCELRLDSTNNRAEKKIIQAVSGVAGDVMDMYGTVHYFQSMGVLSDVTDSARELGYDGSQTWAAVVPEISVEGRQYAFPCNVYVRMLWVNPAVFRKYGLEPPPRRWTWSEFERVGKQLVKAAREPGQRQTVFLAENMDLQPMYRSLGLSRFNETMTRCMLDDARFVRTLKKLHQWTYEDHLLPTLSERESFDTAAGYGGPTLQLFHRGKYATFVSGRYALIKLRQFGQKSMAVSEVPHGGFPNSLTGTRCAVVYKGSERRELAKYFLAYLASEKYNRLIVEDADALPPNPKYTDTEAFKRPVAYPNEWGVHEVFGNAARTIAIAQSRSPFIVHRVAQRYIDDAREAYMNGLLTAEEAAKQAASRINAEIQRTIEEDPEAAKLYEKLLADQKRIDKLRAAGEPVPVELVRNPFHLKYYEHKGWLK